MSEQDPKEIWFKLSYTQRLAATAVIFETICQHARSEGTFRYLIYDRLGFNTDAYAVLYGAGGMNISNNFSLQPSVQVESANECEHVTQRWETMMEKIIKRDWLKNKLEEMEDDPEFAFESALLAFEEELAKRQIQMPPEFAELVEKHFWELF